MFVAAAQHVGGGAGDRGGMQQAQRDQAAAFVEHVIEPGGGAVGCGRYCRRSRVAPCDDQPLHILSIGTATLLLIWSA